MLDDVTEIETPVAQTNLARRDDLDPHRLAATVQSDDRKTSAELFENRIRQAR